MLYFLYMCVCAHNSTFKCFKGRYHRNFFRQDFYFFQSYTYVSRDFVCCIIGSNLAVFHIPLQADHQGQMSHALEEIPARFSELPSTHRQL
jgi:hypothetical protein